MFNSLNKPSVDKNAFEQERRSQQSQMLQDNLKKGSLSSLEQAEILTMRAELPTSYHQIPQSKPSQCFWLFENVKRPEKPAWRNQRSVGYFEACESEFLDEIKIKLSVAPTSV